MREALRSSNRCIKYIALMVPCCGFETCIFGE
jgi:hypothetical protein